MTTLLEQHLLDADLLDLGLVGGPQLLLGRRLRRIVTHITSAHRLTSSEFPRPQNRCLGSRPAPPRRCRAVQSRPRAAVVGAGRRCATATRSRSRARWRTGAVQRISRSNAAAAGYGSSRCEVEQLAVEPVSKGAPDVLLDQPVGEIDVRDALVDVARSLRHAGHDQRRERLGFGRGRLRVADPDLDRAERQMRSDRPPHLGVLDDRAGRDQELDVVRERGPAAKRVWHAAARKALGERLRAGAVQPGVAAVEEWRVGRDRQQHRQHRPQPVADEHRAVGAVDPDVDVQRERVVAPRDVLQSLLDAAVVLGLDDVLVAVVRPRMGAGRAERDVLLGREREQPPPQLALSRLRSGEVGPAAGADLDLGGDQLAGDRLGEQLGSARAAARSSSKRGTSPSPTGSSSANSSSSPTVKSVEASKAARAMSRSSSTTGCRSGQVEVQRVEQVDGRARGVHGDLGRHLQQRV